MQPDQDISQTPQPSVTEPVVSNKPSMSKKPLYMLLILLLVLAAGAGGYFYGHSQSKSSSGTTNQTASQKAPSSSGSSSGSAHFVSGFGTPFDLKTSYEIKLGLPGSMQGVITLSGNNNRGDEQYFTDKYNDELARYSLGFPDDPHSNGGGPSEISILAIGKSWLQSATDNTQDLAAFNSLDMQTPINTPAQKSAYISKLKTDTAACATDTGKGFKTTGDVPLNVCYTLSFGKDGYDPTMQLYGYGEAQSEPIILVGFISIYDSTQFVTSDQAHSAITAAQKGNYTDPLKKQLQSILGALPQTQITKVANNS